MLRLGKGLSGLLVILFVAFSLAGGSALAQTGTTSLRGTVTDTSGAAVGNAKITISSAEIGVTLTTNSDKDGAYQFLEVRPATYVLTAEAPGFATVKQSGLVLLVATPQTNDLKLAVAAVATTVEVVSAAQTVNTTDATIGNAFNQTQISALPFEGRDPAAILSLQPGVATVADRDQVDLKGDSRGGAVNGGRSDQTNLTLDGIDNNDQTLGTAFVGALRTTLDSIEEFRVTTTNAGADQGRSSGAQVQLVTKSGTNAFHGTAYEYNRPTNTVANDYFNKHSQLTTCLADGTPLSDKSCNKPPRLLRNTFGGSFGGPVKRDRLFFFLAYEGQRTRENSQQLRQVPSQTMREGILLYQCADAGQCPGGTAQVAGLDPNFSPQTYAVDVPPGYRALSAPEIASMDPNCSANGVCPWGPGVNPNVLNTLNQYPVPNTNQGPNSDGVNYQGYTFSSPAPNKLDTYVAKIDYNLTQSGTQHVFARFGLQNDNKALGEWFPGEPAQEVDTNNSKGVIAGYTWTISPTKVNSLHYGYVRQGVGQNGSSTDPFVRLRGLDTPVARTRTTSVIVPVHNVTDDFSWTRGKHTLQFGGNYRLVTNFRNSDANSFSEGFTNSAFLPAGGIANQGGTFDPGSNGFPAVSDGFANSYDFAMMALAGSVSELDTTYVQNKSGQFQPPGSFVGRHFRDNEVELYAQDAWRVKSNLTFTYGLRYSLLQPPYETDGNQVNPSISLHDFFDTRMKEMVQGVSFNPLFTMDLSGPANGKPGYWGWDYKNIAPRVSLAYSPGYREGLLGSLFGGPGKSSIRLGAGVYYDHFGQGTINTYDRQGSFGFISTSTFPPGFVDLDTAPRYTGLHDLPPGMIVPAPPAGFPSMPPSDPNSGGFAIYWGLDDKMKTPYSYAFDFSVTRELKGGFTFEAAYVGRLGRRLMQEKDLSQPLNLFDPASGIGYFQAVTALAKVYRQGVFTNNFDPATLPANVQKYWTDMLQPLLAGGAYQLGVGLSPGQAGCRNPSAPLPGSTTNPIVAVYDLFCVGSLNETTPLSVWDLSGIPDANLLDASGNPIAYFPKNGPNSFFQAQDASLFTWTSSGRSNYNALQLMLRRRATHGLTWDFNYTYSKSIDMSSDAERVSLFEGSFFGTGEIYNPFSPGLFRAVSDYDMTHQINTNWVYELPFGRQQKWGKGWNRALDALLGGWGWSGLAKWTSGLPFGVQNGLVFPTNWELNGFANLVGPKPRTGVVTDCDGDANVFAALAASRNDCGAGNSGPGSTLISGSFDYPFPGEVGQRNNLRGPGYFGIDLALSKTWSLTERQKLAFNWSVYNINNSVRFDIFSALPEIDINGSFGKFSQTLTRPRVMEFALRYSF
jgi:hypothetical protein